MTSTLTWKMLALVVRSTDVTFTDPATGQSRRVATTLTAAEEDGVIEAARQTPKHILDWSDGMGRTTLDVLTVNDTVRSVTSINGGFWVAPSDVATLLDTHAPNGSYDSVFVVWDPDGTTGKVPTCCYYGMGRSASTNQATYAAIPVFGEGPSTNPTPGEAFVHEWLHGSMTYYRGERGFATPDPHDNALYGYPSSTSTGPEWYTGLLSGTLVHQTTNVRAGVSSTVWDSGTPTRPVSATMGPPTHLRATTSAGRVSLYWTANSLADHYRIYRGTSSGNETYLAWTGGTSMADSSTTPGVTYYYVARSVGSNGSDSGVAGNRISITP